MPASNPEDEEKVALRTKVSVMERELKQRNVDFTKLRDEVQQLIQFKQKCETQQEVIVGLRSELEFARAAHASALETIEKMKRDKRDAEHRMRVERVHAGLGDGHSLQTKRCFEATERNSNLASGVSHVPGSVVHAGGGPQIVYNSSDISSLGFAPARRPVDFLGGAQFQSHAGDVGAGGDEETEVDRLMAMSHEEALLNIKFAEVEDHEEAELAARLEALRRGR